MSTAFHLATRERLYLQGCLSGRLGARGVSLEAAVSASPRISLAKLASQYTG